MKRRAIKTISLLWLGSIIGAGCSFFTQIILARDLGPGDYGKFSSVLATVVLLVPLAGFGISQYWLKVFGQEGWAAMRWFIPSFRLLSVSTGLVIFTLILWALFGPHDKEIESLLYVLCVYVLGQVALELVSSKLQLEERYFHLSLWQLLPHFARLLLIISLAIFFSENMSLHIVAYIYSGIALTFALLASIELSNIQISNFHLKGHNKELKCFASEEDAPTLIDVIEKSWPFGLASLFQLIYFQSDIILVKYITGAEAAGIYNVAFIIIAAVLMLPSVVYQKFLLPKIHRWANHDRDRFYQVYRQGNILMAILGILAMLIVWTLSSWALPLLFGDNYIDSVLLLNILAICLPILFVASSVGATLVTQEYMRVKVKYMGVVAILNIALNIILIPILGALGAAISTVLSNGVLLIVYYRLAQNLVFSEV